MRGPEHSRYSKVRYIGSVAETTISDSPGTPVVCLPADPAEWAQQALGFAADPKQAEILRCNDSRSLSSPLARPEKRHRRLASARSRLAPSRLAHHDDRQGGRPSG